MGVALTELTRIFRDFVYRDCVYIGGGFTVLCSGLHAINHLTPDCWSTVHIVYFAFLSYVLGYTTMEIFSILGIVTTDYQKPKRLLCWLLERWGGNHWADMPTRDDLPLEKLYLVLSETNVEKRDFIYRILNLKHLGSTMGACFLLSSVILGVKLILGKTPPSHQELIISVGLFIFGLALTTTGKMQAALQIRYMIEIGKDYGIQGKESPSLGKKKQNAQLS